MNQHTPLPPSNVRPVQWQPEDFAARSNEQFVIIRGKREPFIDGDLFDRASVIQEVANDCETLRQVIAFDLSAGTSRDATDDITGVVIQRWAEDGKLLTTKQREFVAMCKGEAFANCFRLEEVA
jgi:hypothetical protein